MGRHLRRIDPDLWLFGRLIRRVDSREIPKFPTTGLLIQPLRIALLPAVERVMEEALNESLGLKRIPTIRRSERNGEMNDANTIKPASTISFATSPTRRIF